MGAVSLHQLPVRYRLSAADARHLFRHHGLWIRASCALDFSDSGTVRFQEIVKLITECGFSVHDISRVELDEGSKLPRFNMPLELGADLGIRLAGSAKQRGRRTLILDAEHHRYDKTLWDISGMDIEAHANDPARACPVLMVPSKREKQARFLD